MYVSVNAGDRSVAIDQVFSSHAVLTLVHLDMQSELHLVHCVRHGAGSSAIFSRTCRSLTQLVQLP